MHVLDLEPPRDVTLSPSIEPGAFGSQSSFDVQVVKTNGELVSCSYTLDSSDLYKLNSCSGGVTATTKLRALRVLVSTGPGVAPLGRVLTDVSYAHRDRMGSIVALSDDVGEIVELYDYKAYGARTVRDSAGSARQCCQFDNSFGFQGHPQDEFTGFVDMRNRTYWPILGQFLQPDPLGRAVGTNLYAFVNSAPLKFLDPFGLSPTLRSPTGQFNIVGRSGDSQDLKYLYLLPKDLDPRTADANTIFSQLRTVPFSPLAANLIKGVRINENGKLRIIHQGGQEDDAEHFARVTDTDRVEESFLQADDLIIVKDVVTVAAGAIRGVRSLTRLGGVTRGALGEIQGLTRRQAGMIDALRGGKDVVVRDINEARVLIDGMPDLRPYNSGSFFPTAPAPRGTFRGDLINTSNPTAPFVHAPGTAPPSHALGPHYNLYFHSGEKATILIRSP
jgi:RHS repeat-associated protein